MQYPIIRLYSDHVENVIKIFGVEAVCPLVLSVCCYVQTGQLQMNLVRCESPPQSHVLCFCFFYMNGQMFPMAVSSGIAFLEKTTCLFSLLTSGALMGSIYCTDWVVQGHPWPFYIKIFDAKRKSKLQNIIFKMCQTQP